MGPAASSLGKYRLIAELGRGGMAEVFLALAAGPGGFNKLVVLKRIRPHLAEDPDFLRMFLDEARLAARLNHPNIVQTNEIGCEDEQYFMAMEYLEGQPLNRVRNRLKRQPDAFPLAMHLRLICDVLSGLHYAHELTDYDGTPLGVVHRDASPHNTFVTYAGQVKLMDFGIAKAMNSSAETRAGMLKGKVPYMAPEQARGEGVDRRADIFSVGVMIWEALAGRRLWQDHPDVAVLKWLVDESPSALPFPRQYNPRAPALLEAICMRAVSPMRTLRQATALELRHELEHALASLPEQHRARDAGPVVARFFAEERTRIRRLVEQQLSRVRNEDQASFQRVSLPQLGPATISGTPSGAGGYTPSAPSHGGYTPSAPSHGGFTPSSPHGPPSSDASGVAPVPCRSGSAAEGAWSTPPQDEPSAETLPRGPRRSVPPALSSVPSQARSSSFPVDATRGSGAAQGGTRRSAGWWMVGAGGAVALGLGAVAGVWVLWSPPQRPAGETEGVAVSSTAVATVRASTTVAAAPAVSKAPRTETIRLSIQVEPEHARIHVDGQPVRGNPHEARVERDDEEHEIRAEAQGYLPWRRSIAFDADVDLELELRPARPARVLVRTPPPPPPSAAPEPEAEAADPEEEDWMKKRWPQSTRPIDEENPYGK